MYSRSPLRVRIVVGLPSAFCRSADGLPSGDRRATVGRPSGTDIIEIECKGSDFLGNVQIFCGENANFWEGKMETCDEEKERVTRERNG